MGQAVSGAMLQVLEPGDQPADPNHNFGLTQEGGASSSTAGVSVERLPWMDEGDMGPILHARINNESRYVKEVGAFLSFYECPNVSTTLANADYLAYVYRGYLFEVNAPKTRGTNLVAGLRCWEPTLRVKGQLPWSSTAAFARCKMEPTVSHPPALFPLCVDIEELGSLTDGGLVFFR